MGDINGFLKYPRRDPEKDPIETRVRDHREFERRLPLATVREQGARCMSCGVPFCHTGCPLGNAIPDWNDLVHKDKWREANAALLSTNNFPEVTGRICPAPCEAACVAGIHDEPVAIKAIERAIADHGLEQGFYEPRRAERPTGKKIAVVGSGPAGLACAQQLARAGHTVTVIERDDKPGGLLRYGIPDFKLDKAIVDLRISQMQAEGVIFHTGVCVGETVTLGELRMRHDAVVLATGASRPRDLDVPGRALNGIHFAMDYLVDQNRVNANPISGNAISAKGKKVLILGGGDTGSDCMGTAIRQGASSILQIELLPRPPAETAPETPWPLWPLLFRTSSSQEEGGERDFAVLTKRFIGDGNVKAIEAVRVDWITAENGLKVPIEREGTTFAIKADLVLLAMGFVGPSTVTLRGGSLAQDDRGNVLATTKDFATSTDGVFACGDVRRGQSLVVWAIWEGRETARSVDAYLVGQLRLPTSPYVLAP